MKLHISLPKDPNIGKLKTVWLKKIVRRPILSQAGTRVKVAEFRSHIDNKVESSRCRSIGLWEKIKTPRRGTFKIENGLAVCKLLCLGHKKDSNWRRQARQTSTKDAMFYEA
ncbi:hypothetical protein [Rhizobium mesoamericanum]|uniref:hypothetical protein n=1 Tax=Rhizobium mesoamericanum TaxID=1079800 RepID=UPI0004204AA8|nr:hypothetical protein [Rhizobium mesoamericanum]